MPHKRLHRPRETVLRSKERLWSPPCATRTAPGSPFLTPGWEYRKLRARGYLSPSSPPSPWGRARDKDWHWPTPPSSGGTEARYGSTLNWEREPHSTFGSHLRNRRKG